MKKVVLAVGCGLAVVAGGLLIWNVVLPFIGWIFETGFGFAAGLLA